MISGNDLRIKRKQLSLSVEKLAQQIGVSEANLYKWENAAEVRPRDPEDYRKLERFLKEGVENVLPENGTSSKKSNESDFKADYGHDFSSLVQSNLKLANAQEKLAIAQENISESNKELSRQIGFIARESEESSLAAAGNLEAIRLILRQLSLKAKLFHSDAEFDRAYDKSVGESLKKRKVDGSAHSLGKPHKVKT